MGIIRFLLPLIFLAIFAWSLFSTTPPKSLVEASFLQIIYFFLPLLLFLTALLNLFYRNILKSLIVGFGLTLLVFLKGLGSLNWVTLTITLAATVLLAKSFKNTSLKFSQSTAVKKLPKVTPNPAKSPPFRKFKKRSTNSHSQAKVKLSRIKS